MVKAKLIGSRIGNIKDFNFWAKICHRLELKHRKRFYEREIWIAHVGANFGTQICGKGELFLRPILIYKKLSKNGFWGIPLSSKKGKFVKRAFIKSTNSYIVADQIRYFDSKLLLREMSRIKLEEFHILLKGKSY